MKKVKAFAACYPYDIAGEINEWIETNQEFNIKDVKIQASGSRFLAIVIYTIKEFKL